MFHCNPSALLIGSLSRSRFLSVLSSAGMAANTSFLLETNFVSWKFPLQQLYQLQWGFNCSFGGGHGKQAIVYVEILRHNITHFLAKLTARTISHWHSLRSLVRYCSCHSNIKFISSRHHVRNILYIWTVRYFYLIAGWNPTQDHGDGNWTKRILFSSWPHHSFVFQVKVKKQQHNFRLTKVVWV